MLKNQNSNSMADRTIKKMVMKTLGKRDFAAQETMHHLLSLRLHSSTFKVIPSSLTGSRPVHKVSPAADNGDNDVCTDNSLLDVYANCHQYEDTPAITNMNFLQIATTFQVVNNKLKKLPDNVIPIIFPTYCILQIT